ncbi:MAG: type IV pilus secretin PilQ [Mariprofundaceae bacterium]|nr:type IV pilus secretin PilQ [Mariprofundaceae bacterium]
MKSSEGDVLSIKAKGELDYQSFDLSAPPRLVLSFPNTSLGKTVKSISSPKPGIRSVSTSVSKAGARLDVGMSKSLTYKVEQTDGLLNIRFAPVSGNKAKASADTAILKDLTIRDHGGVTELVVRGEHMNASHDAFVTNHGRTLIMDFWGASSLLAKEHYAAATQKVGSVTVGEAKGRVRLVVNLLPGVSDKHQINATAGEMLVRFGSVTAKRKVAEIMVQDVRFKANDRISQLEILTSVSNPIINLHEEKGAAIVDISKAALAKGQERSQDVSEFPGPLSQVDAYKAGDKVRIVARLRDKVEISSFQKGKVLTLTFVPKDLATAKRGIAKGDAFAYTGQKVSFDYQGIDIRNALRLIAEMSDMNFIMTDDVQGKLTMRLENVPWDQALDIILVSQGLGKEQQGNVMRIAPIPILAKERKGRLEARQSAAELAPLVTEFISLSYAKASEVKALLEDVKAADTGTATAGATATSPASPSSASTSSASSAANGMLSPRGSFVVDERTNTLIIKDTEDSIQNIKRLIARIDQPVKQVLIEARIVEATDNFTRELGVRWGGQVTGRGGKVTNQISNTSAGAGGFLVDLPAASALTAGGQIGLAVGAINNAFNLNLELSAAEADDKIKIVSNPRVVTTNLKTAKINQGRDIPFQTVSANNGTKIEFKKANLGLEVTPQITADNRIMLQVKATKDAPVANAAVAGNPIISTKQIETEIFMNNGETIVIGGIYTRDKSKNTGGLPLLSKIPLLGWLFKKQTKTDNKTELLIFITPTIMEPSTQAGTENATRL